MSPRKMSDETYAELLADADAFTRERVMRDGRFFRNELAAHLASRHGRAGQASLGPGVLGRLLVDLGADHLGAREGYSRRGMLRIPPATLADLAELARSRVDTGYTPPRGRRATRDVWTLSPAQLTNVLTAAGEIAEMVTGGRGALSDVGPEHLAWCSSAGEGGQGEWALVERIETYSDATAAREHLEIRRLGSPAWHRDLNKARRKAAAAGVRILLDLAATCGRITRGDTLQSSAHAPRRAAEWHPVCEAWTARLTADIGRSPRKLEQGIKTLALYATRQGAHSPADTPWGLVRDAIERDARLAVAPLSNDIRTWAAYAYRALLERGRIEGPLWPKATNARVSLVQTGLARASVPTGEFASWQDDCGQHPTALCEMLTEWHRWSTLPDDLLEDEHRQGRLPLREWSNPTQEQQLRAARDSSLFRLKPATIEGRLASFNLQAGYSASRRAVDFAVDPDSDLALVDPDALQAHLRERHPGGVDAKDQLIATMGWHLATLASPFLEARALLQHDHAMAAGNAVRAAELSAKAAKLRECATKLQVRAARATPSKRARDGDGEELTRKQIQKIWQLWTVDGVSGWHKLGKMRDAMIVDVERLGARCVPDDPSAGADSLPLAQQVIAVREGRFRPTMTWAALVRDALIITVLWKVPLRVRNVVGMTLTNLKLLGGGAMHLEFAADEVKADRPFEPTLFGLGELGESHAVAMVRPDLWELYLMAGGARDEVLRLRPESLDSRGDSADPAIEASAPTSRPDLVCPSRYVFPAIARKGGGHGVQLAERARAEFAYDGDGFTAQFKKRVVQYAGVMNIDPEALSQYFGATAPHIVRLLFGSHHCDPDRWHDAIGLEAASALLHHASTDITARKYVARNERNTSAVSGRTGGRRPGLTHTRPSPVAALVPRANSGYARTLSELLVALGAGHIDAEEFRLAKLDLMTSHIKSTEAGRTG